MKWRPGARVPKRWWEQDGLDLVGARAEAAREEATAEEEYGSDTGSGTRH